MAAPSLTGPRNRLLNMMSDACTITRTTATPVDDAIDPLTLKPAPVSGETPTTVYTGACFVTEPTATSSDTLAQPDQSPAELGLYDVFLPHDAAMPQPGDVVTLTTVGDVAMVGLVLVVTAVTVSTLNLARVAHTQTVTPARPVHGR